LPSYHCGCGQKRKNKIKQGKKQMSKNVVVINFDALVTQFAQASNLTHTPGRVFDKVHAGNQEGRYMVERSTGYIYGIKSWNQYNPRRFYGNLSEIDQWDWSVFPATPKAGTQAEMDHNGREATFASTYKKRGRPVGAKNKAKTLSSSATQDTP
jgi:hypothetical protein